LERGERLGEIAAVRLTLVAVLGHPDKLGKHGHTGVFGVFLVFVGEVGRANKTVISLLATWAIWDVMEHQHPLAQAMGAHFKGRAVRREWVQAGDPYAGCLWCGAGMVVLAVVENDFK